MEVLQLDLRYRITYFEGFYRSRCFFWKTGFVAKKKKILIRKQLQTKQYQILTKSFKAFFYIQNLEFCIWPTCIEELDWTPQSPCFRTRTVQLQEPTLHMLSTCSFRVTVSLLNFISYNPNTSHSF